MNEELQIAAAEYVLGTLPADERARLAVELQSNPDLRAAVRSWQRRLAPLDMATEAVAPPAGLWPLIESRAFSPATSPASDGSPNVVRLGRRLVLWRSAALATGALAAGLAGILVLDPLAVPPEPAGNRYVAVVDTGGHEPALIAEVDTATGIIRVRSVAAQTPQGQSLELWHVAEGHEPRSLGILRAGGAAQTIQDVATAGPVDGVIAVTLEPQGGSPSGAPTGPVVYSGRLIPVE